MASQLERDRLVKAASALIGKTLTTGEADTLVNNYDHGSGTQQARARKALSTATGLTEGQLTTRSSVPDNTGRLLDEIINEIKK